MITQISQFIINLFHYIVALLHRAQGKTTYNFDHLVYQGHPDFGAMFALYPSDEYPEFLVVKMTDDPEYTTYHYDDFRDLDAEYYQLQLSYSEWLQHS